jgi:hypothetical protein
MSTANIIETRLTKQGLVVTFSVNHHTSTKSYLYSNPGAIVAIQGGADPADYQGIPYADGGTVGLAQRFVKAVGNLAGGAESEAAAPELAEILAEMAAL